MSKIILSLSAFLLAANAHAGPQPELQSKALPAESSVPIAEFQRYAQVFQAVRNSMWIS